MAEKRQPSNNRASDVTPYLTTDGGQEIELDTPAFLNWLEQNDSFRFEAGVGGEDSYRARKEKLSGVDYWYAVKKVSGRLHKKFIGRSNEVTRNRLIEVSQTIRQPPKSKKQVEDATATKTSSTQNEQPQQNAITVLTEQMAELKQLVIQQQKAIEELAGKSKAR
ncbi:hypothetical protein SD81_028420 [Tolypothrix campylonemoides VB511288]|nr:hypothetical protein SD81_028420 [Tolypothrix campylonemoides VB511288]